jgi:hypothetical protein
VCHHALTTARLDERMHPHFFETSTNCQAPLNSGNRSVDFKNWEMTVKQDG